MRVVRRCARTGLIVLTVTGLLSGALVGATVATGATAAVDPVSPMPPPPVVEDFAPPLPQVSCDPIAKPGTLALRAMTMAAYGGRDLGVVRSCGAGGSSEHKEGRAWDWGVNAAVPVEKALGDRFVAWLTAPGPDGVAAFNARRLGVMYVIWNRRIWSSYRADQGSARPPSTAGHGP